jgi:3-oxoacyl-[acyl-carrier protein] reductase
MSDAAKVALVTGGNRGIGLAIAKELAAQGVKVIIGHRSGVAPSGFESVLIDVSDTKSVDSAVSEIDAKHGGVDILVANAGITKDGLVMRMSDDDFESVVNTNLTGAFRVARATSKNMMKKRRPDNFYWVRRWITWIGWTSELFGYKEWISWYG